MFFDPLWLLLLLAEVSNGKIKSDVELLSFFLVKTHCK
jgi:hypothetical protein